VPHATKILLGKSNQYEQHLHHLLKNNPLLIHFLDAFLADPDVPKVAKISCFGPAKKFFQKLFGRLVHHKDVAFDSVCQELNKLLVVQFTKCMLLHDSQKNEANWIQFNEHLIKFLQSSTLTDIVESCAIPEFHCQPGMCIILQTLWKTPLDIVQNQLPSKIVKSLHSTPKAVNFKVKVNSFFGWAIAEVHKSLLKELESDFEGNNPSIQARLDSVSGI
jgi:hypothetical protein